MTQTAGSVSSCLRVLGNKEVADLEKELITIFIYTTLFLLSLPFLFFQWFSRFCFFPDDVWSCIYSEAKQPLTNRHKWHLCVFYHPVPNRQQCKSACCERGLSSPGWSQVQGSILSQYTLLNMWCYLLPCTSWQLSHHALCPQVQLVALLACGNVLSSSGFRIAMVTSRFWLLPEVLDVFGSNKLTGFFCCLLDDNQLILHFDHVDYFHLTLNVFTDISFIYAWCGISISKLSDFDMGKLRVSFK